MFVSAAKTSSHASTIFWQKQKPSDTRLDKRFNNISL